MNTIHLDKILVVDDTTTNLQLLTNLLTEHGYTVFPASDGELALEFVRSILPDLIMLDIRMPGMDGYEVCRRLKADGRTRSIPVIFISILEDERDKVKGFREGAVDYITKPFQPEEVLARIKTHLHLRELTEHLEQIVAERTEELTVANQRLQREAAEHRRATDKLSASETRYRALFEGVPDALVIADLETGAISDANPSAARLFGRRREELLDMNQSELHPVRIAAQIRQSFREHAQEAGRGRISGPFEHIAVRADGVEVPVEIMTQPVTIDGKTLIQGVFRDISERKQSEQERQENLRFFECLDRVNRAIQGTSDLEQMMSDVLDTMLSIFGCDRAFLAVPCDPTMPEFKIAKERTTHLYAGALAHGLMVPMSPAVKKLFHELLSNPAPNEIYIGNGLDPDDVVWKTYEIKSQLAIALFPKVGPPWECGLHQCSYNRVWTPQEKKLFLEISRHLEDTLTSFLIYLNLKESEEKYRRIVDTANEGIWTLGPDGLTTFVNARMAEMLGYSVDEMIGRSVADFVFEEDMPDHLRRMETRRQGISEHFERRFRRKDGQTVWTLVSGTPIVDAERCFQGAFGMHTDVTERKQSEDELRHLKDKLEERVRDRTTELEVKNSELERLNRLFVGRELRMVELKKRIKELEEKSA